VLILSPVDRAAEIPELVAAGAEELYAGYVPPFWAEAFGPVVSCNRRSYDEANAGTLEGLDALVNAAAVRDVPVYVALNASPIPDGMIPRMVELVGDLSRRGVRGVIVSDLSLLLSLRDARLRRTELHASTLFSAFNGMTVAFLRRAGATRVILARELSTDEIAAMVPTAGGTRLEAIGFRGRCPNIEGFCTHLHDDPGRTWPCELRYEKEWRGRGDAIPADVLEAIGRNEGADRYYSCGLCAVPLLERAGVHALKIVGRGSETARKVDAVRAVAAMREWGRRTIPGAAECARRGKQAYREAFGRPCRPENCYFPEFRRSAGQTCQGGTCLAVGDTPCSIGEKTRSVPPYGKECPPPVGKSVPPQEYHYLGPDGDGIASLPDGVGAALGSDYCVHLLPTPGGMKEVVAVAAARRAPLVLLTPYFRDAELKRAIPLFREIPEGADVDVAVNDWGAMQTLRGLFPRLTLSIGRLLSGQKRCPRIGVSPRLTEEGRAWHGEGVFSSKRARRHLAAEYGVTRYHLDDLPWGAGIPGEVEGERDGTRFYLHSPWAVVTVSDACPWIGGKSSAAVATCARPCREGEVALREPSMGAGMRQRGKARFARSRAGGCRPDPPGIATAVVLYGELP